MIIDLCEQLVEVPILVVFTILFIFFVESFYQFDEKCITYYNYIYIYILIILFTNKNAITIKS